MTIQTPTLLTAGGSGTDGTVFTSAVISPPADSLLVLFVDNGSLAAGENGIPTIGGSLGLTWTQRVSNTQFSGTVLRGTFFTAVVPAQGASGNITMTFANVQSSCHWHVARIMGANNDAPITQSGSFLFNTATNPTFNLGMPPASDSLIIGAAMRNSTTAYTAGANHTILSSVAGNSGPTIGSDLSYDPSPASQAVGFTTASAAQKTLFGLEIANAPADTPVADAGADQINKTAGSTVALSAAGSTANGPIESYEWTQISGDTVALEGTGPGRTFDAPTTSTGATLVFRVRVTYNGLTDYDDVTVTVLAASGLVPGNATFVRSFEAVDIITSNTFPFEVPADLEVGETLVLALNRITGASVGTIQSIDGLGSNVWSNPATAVRGSTHITDIVVIPITQEIVSGTDITINYTSGSPTRKALAASVWSGLLGFTDVASAAGGANGSTGAASVSTASATTKDNVLTIGAFGIGDVVWTPSGGSTTINRIATTVGTSDRGVVQQYRKDTGLEVKTSAGTVSGSWAGAVVALPISPAPVGTPRANAGPDQVNVDPNATVALTAAASTPASGTTISSYSWEQISGPAVVLSGSGAGRTFPAPDLSTESTLVFRVTVTASNGLTNYDEVTVKVLAVYVPPTGSGIATLVRKFKSVDSVSSNSTSIIAPADLEIGQVLVMSLARASGSGAGTITGLTGIGTNAWHNPFQAVRPSTLIANTIIVPITQKILSGTTITISWTGGSPNRKAIVASVWSGLTGAIGVASDPAGSNGAAGAASAATSAATTSAKALQIGTFVQGNTTWTPGAGHTLVDASGTTVGTGDRAAIQQYKVESVTGIKTSSGTAAGSWAGGVITLPITSAPAGTPTAQAGVDQLNVEPWDDIEISAIDSLADGGTITNYSWSQLSGEPVVLVGTGHTREFEAPGTTAGTTLIFRVTVTSSSGLSDHDDVQVTVLPASERIVVNGVEVPLKIMSL